MVSGGGKGKRGGKLKKVQGLGSRKSKKVKSSGGTIAGSSSVPVLGKQEGGSRGVRNREDIKGRASRSNEYGNHNS